MGGSMRLSVIGWSVAMGLMVGFGGSASMADVVSGFVREDATLMPIPDAIVSLKAGGIRTTTAPDGSFSLDLPPGTGLVIAGAKKGYYTGSVTVNTPAASAEILLQTVPQGDDPSYTFVEPETCGGCHPDQYDQWVDSPMFNAGTNTWVADIYNGTGTAGGMGGFVYTLDSVFAESNPNSECASCHQPEVWIESPFSALVDLVEPIPAQALHGISCEVCHKVADVDVDKINFPGIFPGALTFTRPEDSFTGQVVYGVLGDVDYFVPTLMRASYQPQMVAELCGACHQDKNDPDENHTYTGVTSEPTYVEWADSPYGDPASPHYATCVDCHMPPSGETDICSFQPIPRDSETIRDHDIRGTTPYFLENAADLAMQVQQEGAELRVDVTATNSLTGHHVPTGVTVRNMILLVEAWRDGDDPLVSPLVHTGSQIVHELGGVGDPAQGYYAGLPGRFYAKVNFDAQGNGPTFFTDAAGIEFDNRIPALGVDPTTYTFALPPEGGQIRVRSRLIYRRAFRFLVDAKQWTEDGHGNPLADVAAPHFGHLMEIQEASILVNVCGDGVVGDGEQCDDGNTNPDDFCDAECQFNPAHAIPTVSEWGLGIMLLLLLTAGTIVLSGLRWSAAGGAVGPQVAGAPEWTAPPFDGGLLARVFAAALGLVFLVWVGAAGLFEAPAAVDVVGSLICVPILAYLVHLWVIRGRG